MKTAMNRNFWSSDTCGNIIVNVQSDFANRFVIISTCDDDDCGISMDIKMDDVPKLIKALSEVYAYKEAE